LRTPARAWISSENIYLILLPVFSLCHRWAENPGIVRLRDVLSLLPVYWAAIIIAAIIFCFFYRDVRKGTLASFCVLALFLFFGNIHDGLKMIGGESVFSSYRLLLPLILILLVLVLWVLKRQHGSLSPVVRYLNLLLVILLIIDAINLLRHPQSTPELQPLSGSQQQVPGPLPDIYLIVADGYAGSRELKTYFGFENNDFQKELIQRGFHIVPESRSNYNYTAFSMASLLNMDYLPLKSNHYTDASEQKVSFPLIQKNRFVRYLESAGYKWRNLSIFEIGDEPAAFAAPFFRTGKSVLTSTTLFSRLNRDLRFHLLTRFGWRSELKRYARYSVDEGNRKVMSLTLEESEHHTNTPKFVYTHLLLPHEPYFYKKDGTPNPVEILADYEKLQPDLYVEYLQYANGRLVSLIDGILATSSRPPIILLLSDHGYRSQNVKNGVAAELQFSNLNAILLPSRDYKNWYSGISNVNHLRVLLNTQFGQHIPLIKDSTIYLLE
jgi:hypothetical protein